MPVHLVDDLEAAIDAVVALVERLDPATLGGAGAAQAFRAFERGVRVCDAGKALAASRVAATGHWKLAKARSPQDWVRRESGGSLARSREVLARGEAMDAMPEIGEAAVAGEVAPEAVDKIGKVVTVDRAGAAKLLGQARAGSDLETIRRGAVEVAARAEDEDARAARLHRGRRLRTWTDDEGFWNLQASASPMVGAELMSLLDPWIQARRSRGDADGQATIEQRSLDGLLDMARVAASDPTPTGSAADDAAADGDPRPPRLKNRGRTGSDAKVFIRIDLPALARGRAVGGEDCEVVGFGPIPVSSVERMLIEGDAFVAAVFTRATQVLGVTHLGRRPKAHQRTAVEWLFKECSVEGCHRIARLQFDHDDPWGLTYETATENLGRLCVFHHQDKTRDDCRKIREHRAARAEASPRPDGPAPPPEALRAAARGPTPSEQVSLFASPARGDPHDPDG